MATSKCTWIFAAINRAQHSYSPLRLRVMANDKRSARQSLTAHYMLFLASLMPFRGGRHA